MSLPDKTVRNPAEAKASAVNYADSENWVYYGVGEDKDEQDRRLALAYQDVSDAFKYYLENENNGRPIILAGFSQGSDYGAGSGCGPGGISGTAAHLWAIY